MSEPSSRASGPRASGPSIKVALVFTGGDPVPDAVLAHLPNADVVIAADSGLEEAQSLGCAVDLVVGDFDSVDPSALADAEDHGASVERHPAAKDATDLELALIAALARGAQRVTVVGGHGGRLDHFLANALLLASDAFAALTIDAWMASAHVTVVRERTELRGTPGSLCTLIPVGGAARGITTEGLQYPLASEDLEPGSSRGVSNVLVGSTATVTLQHGVLLAVQPHALGERT
ncbi:MAG: thiamine diphosphokinase [Acidimicrobiia bacterium]|nr:thiamine diphosphokinase [Acidimicrobiia bacterium]